MGKKDEPTRMPDGRYRRDIGWKPDGRGGYMQHRFYLGRDRGEALVRNIQLERTWEAAERKWQRRREKTHHAGERPVWDTTTLLIAQAVARGEALVSVTPPEHLQAGLDTARDKGWSGMLRSWQGGVVEWLHQLQADFPHVRIELADGELLREGEDEVRSWTEILEGQLEALRPGPAATGQTLHQALEGYSEWIRRNYLSPGGEVSPGGNKMLREVKILKEHHEDMALGCYGLNEIEAMLTHWKHRPMTKRGKVCSPETSRDMIKRVRTFVRWLHKSPGFSWRKPIDLESTPVRIAATPEEVAARLNPAQVETYTLDELCLLYEYASPWERLLMLLALNCGFGVAEISTLLTTESQLRQPHGHYPKDGSWIKRVRFKSAVYGEWSLWDETIRAVEWQMVRRGQTKESAFVLTRHGQPLSKPTAGNNRNNKIPNTWSCLLARVRKDMPEFRRLSFNKLRKTAANLVRRFGDGETAAVFLCHGRPVKADALLDLYTDRHFDKVFAALDRVHAYLAPMFVAVTDPFPADMKKHNPSVSLGQVKKMQALRDQGHPLRKVAEMVGVTPETVRRYCKQDNQES